MSVILSSGARRILGRWLWVIYTVTQKGNALQIWKVAVAGFLFLGTDSIFCLGVKPNSYQRCRSTTRIISDEFRVKEWSDKELAAESWYWPTLEHCGQLQKFCGTLADQYNIASGHTYNI